jgi:hypothetical protein
MLGMSILVLDPRLLVPGVEVLAPERRPYPRGCQIRLALLRR